MLCVLEVVVFLPSLSADTIYQTTPQGKQVIVQRQAILVREDSSILVYKHFDLQQRRVEKVQLSKGSLPYTVVTTSPEDRQRIVDLWKRFGYTASVTDLSGKTTRLFDAYIDYYPPQGRGSLLPTIPAQTSLPLELDGGGADVVDFSDIDRVQFQGGQIKVTLRSGRIESGKFLMPTSQPAEARFLGITSRYDPSSQDVFDFSETISRLRLILFEP